MIDPEAFFTVHRDLPREGPGSDADVAWAVGLADLPEGARICDLGCGPGGDIAALLAAAPGARVLGIDKMPGFVADAQRRFAGTERVTLRQGDMADIAAAPEAPFDMIWCAGALYFLGLDTGLATLRAALRPGGVLAFSEPCFFTETPSEDARRFWEGYPAGTERDITRSVTAAGYTVLATRHVSEDGWNAYFAPMVDRINKIRDTADPVLREACDIHLAEAALWREVRHETGYLLTVARVS